MDRIMILKTLGSAHEIYLKDKNEIAFTGIEAVVITDEEIEKEKKWKYEPCGLYPDGWEDGFSACWNYINSRINQ